MTTTSEVTTDLHEQLALLKRKREDASDKRLDVYARQIPGEAAHPDELAVEDELTRIDRDIQRTEAAIVTEAKTRESDRKAAEVARGDELLEQEVRNLEAYPRVSLELLTALLAVSAALNAEYALDTGLHQTRMELDKLAAATGNARYRRNVVAFDRRFYRPQLQYISGAIEALFEQLQVTTRDGQIVPRERTVPAAPAAIDEPARDQVDDLDDDDEDD
jgi:hypothetical protein